MPMARGEPTLPQQKKPLMPCKPCGYGMRKLPKYPKTLSEMACAGWKNIKIHPIPLFGSGSAYTIPALSSARPSLVQWSWPKTFYESLYDQVLHVSTSELDQGSVPEGVCIGQITSG